MIPGSMGSKYKRKFVKTQDEIANKSKKVVIDLNLDSLQSEKGLDQSKMVDKAHANDLEATHSQVDNEEDGLLLIDMESSDEDKDSLNQDDKPQNNTHELNEADMDPETLKQHQLK